MTYPEALREAERTGCLFFRPRPHAHRDIPDSIMNWDKDPRLGYATSHVCALGVGHAWMSPEEFYWSPKSRVYIGNEVILGHWHRGGGGIWLVVEDFCADDWVTVPLPEWFRDDCPNTWNPLKVKDRWDREKAKRSA
jgi:hypothetical protein